MIELTSKVDELINELIVLSEVMEKEETQRFIPNVFVSETLSTLNSQIIEIKQTSREIKESWQKEYLSTGMKT